MALAVAKGLANVAITVKSAVGISFRVGPVRFFACL